jgi:hypothetical protein
MGVSPKLKTKFSRLDANFRLTNVLVNVITSPRHHDEGVSVVRKNRCCEIANAGADALPQNGDFYGQAHR